MGEQPVVVHEVDAFDDDDEFDRNWWLKPMSGRPRETWVAWTRDGTDIARARLDEHSTVGRYYLDSAPADGFVEIKFVAVAKSARGRGIGRRVVDDISVKFADRELCAFSEADDFWRALGWTEHRRRKDGQRYRLLFTFR